MSPNDFAADSEDFDEDDDEDGDDALSVEPLRALQPDLHNQAAVGPRQVGSYSYRTGKRTELLQVYEFSNWNIVFQSVVVFVKGI